jgi:hypothetical protein
MEPTLPSLEGACVVLAGEFGASARTRLARALAARGAQVKASVSNQTRYLVLGQNPGPRTLEKARARGVTTLTEAQMEALLQGRAVSLPAPALSASSGGLKASLESLRALAYTAPGEGRWESLCVLLEAQAPESLPVALDYARSVVEGWAAPAEGEAVMGEVMPLGELRLAPERWITEACAGRASPLLSLCRGLRYVGKGINGRVAEALLRSPWLEGLRALDLSGNPLSKGFLESLARAPLPSLRRLGLRGVHCGWRGLRALSNGATTAALTHLDLSQAQLGTGEARRRGAVGARCGRRWSGSTCRGTKASRRGSWWAWRRRRS